MPNLVVNVFFILYNAYCAKQRLIVIEKMLLFLGFDHV